MSASWKTISPDKAAVHPLYGVGGWLAVFAIGVLLGLLSEVGSLRGEALKADMSLSQLLSIDHPAITFSKIVLAIDATVVAAIYWLLFNKHPKFRVAASSLLLVAWPLVVTAGLLNQYPGVGSAIALSFFPWAISCAVWVTYLNRSRRVRVTFEHLVPMDEAHSPIIAQPSTTAGNAAHLPVAPQQSRPRTTAGLIPSSRSPAPSSELSTPSDADTANDVEQLWARALAEFESQSRRPGLWAKSFSESGGNEPVAKAAYLASRVLELQREHQAIVDKQQEEERQRCREAEVARLSAEERACALQPKGRCPNSDCGAVMPITRKGCMKCGAIFGSGGWKLIPTEETIRSSGLPSAAAELKR